MAVVLGLLVAVCYGAGDFLGGMTSKRNGPVAVVAASQAVGFVFLLVLSLTVGGGEPEATDLALGAASGSFGLLGLLLLYRGLAVGVMSVIAPITAVGAAVVPVVWGLLDGERPSAAAMVGVVAALAAVALVSAGPPAGGGGATPRRELVLALVAGTAFGAVFVLLGETGGQSGLWPAVTARVASISLVVTGAVVAGRRLAVVSGTWLPVVVTGMFDGGANALFLLASRRGLISLVAVLGSLYPATTVLLARIVLGERLRPPQVAGLALALAGVTLIAAG